MNYLMIGNHTLRYIMESHNLHNTIIMTLLYHYRLEHGKSLCTIKKVCFFCVLTHGSLVSFMILELIKHMLPQMRQMESVPQLANINFDENECITR